MTDILDIDKKMIIQNLVPVEDFKNDLKNDDIEYREIEF